MKKIATKNGQLHDPEIHVTVFAGADIGRTAADMAQMALEYDMPIVAAFNGTTLRAEPDRIADFVAKPYTSKLKERE